MIRPEARPGHTVEYPIDQGAAPLSHDDTGHFNFDLGLPGLEGMISFEWEAEEVAGMLAFYTERTEVTVDGRPFEETVA